MGTELHELKVNGETIGFVPFQNTADVWAEDLFEDREAYRAGRRIGLMHCERPPYSANHHDPHELVWGELHDPWADKSSPWLYCPTCRCVISPPYDGYVYADDYPKEWTRYVRKDVPWERAHDFVPGIGTGCGACGMSDEHECHWDDAPAAGVGRDGPVREGDER